MEIKTYNSNQLNELIRSENFAHMPVAPISTHRAISHIHNPRAEKEDTLMIIAWEKGEMVGYLGVLADRIYTSTSESLKCGWLSCMWVNPALRGKGIAKQLLATAFKTWNDHILVTEFTPEAKGLYDRSGGFTDLRVSHGLRCYLRFNLHEVLPKKSEKYKAYTPILRLIDGLANLPIDLRLSLMKNEKPSSPVFEPMTEVDQETGRYIDSKQANDLEKRGPDELNWILKYPWLIQSGPTEESRRYHFSSVSDRFFNLCLKLTDQGVIKGYLYFTIRENHLKIPYAYFEPQYLPEVVQHIYTVMQGNKLNMLTVFHTSIVEFLKSHPTPFICKRSIKRHYIISKSLDTHFAEKGNLVIQDGDADCAFT